MAMLQRNLDYSASIIKSLLIYSGLDSIAVIEIHIHFRWHLKMEALGT